MAKPFLSVVIPAYNEADRLPFTLIDVDKHLTEEEFSYEILLVDDGSLDGTAEVTRRFLPIVRNLKLINNAGNRGRGAAVKIGMLSARGNMRLIMDADNAIPVSEFRKLMPYFKSDPPFQIVIASRRARGAKINPPLPLTRRCLNLVTNVFLTMMFRSKIKDFLSGFECYAAEAAEKIFSSTRLTGWTLGPEALILGERLGFKIKEVSVQGSHIQGSHFKITDYLQMFWEIIKMRWWLWRKRYEPN